MALKIAVIAEAHADFRVVSTLFDRVVMATEGTPNYIREDSEQLEAEREFCALEEFDERGFTARSRIKSMHSGFGRGGGSRFGKGLGNDLRDTEKCVKLAVKIDDPIDVLILSRDTDGVEERQESWRTVQDGFAAEVDFKIILAGQHCKLEAWLLNGFSPSEPAEESRLAELRQELGFSPVTQAERLNARSHGAKKDAKRVLECLTAGDFAREETCYAEASLDTLKTNGAKSGLKAYLEDVEAECVPLFQ